MRPGECRQAHGVFWGGDTRRVLEGGGMRPGECRQAHGVFWGVVCRPEASEDRPQTQINCAKSAGDRLITMSKPL